VDKKALFPPVRLAVVNSYILLSSCGGKKISHRDFCLTIIREILAQFGHKPRSSMPVGRPAPASTNIGRLDTRHNKHWPGRNPKQGHCRMCSVRGVTRTMLFKCVKCDVALCVDRSFLKITTQKTTYKTYFLSFSVHTVGASTTM